jgi:heterodisulfide reductase subunit C
MFAAANEQAYTTLHSRALAAHSFIWPCLTCCACAICCRGILQGSTWLTLQRLLVRCVLPSLGAQQQQQQHLGIVPGGGLRDLGGAALPAQQVSRLLWCL